MFKLLDKTLYFRSCEVRVEIALICQMFLLAFLLILCFLTTWHTWYRNNAFFHYRCKTCRTWILNPFCCKRYKMVRNKKICCALFMKCMMYIVSLKIFVYYRISILYYLLYRRKQKRFNDTWKISRFNNKKLF